MKPLYAWQMKSPCMDCAERHEGCHGICEKYLFYRKSLDDEKAKKRQNELAEKQSANVLIQGKIKVMKRNRKIYK